jgi:hypothetical protein
LRQVGRAELCGSTGGLDLLSQAQRLLSHSVFSLYQSFLLQGSRWEMANSGRKFQARGGSFQ